MHKIILATINSKYSHCALGLRYLLANLKELISETSIREFTSEQRPVDIAEELLQEDPTIVALGIYIWNLEISTEVVKIIKQINPQCCIVLGGPEISYEYHHREIFIHCDFLITGEAEEAFYNLCLRILSGDKCSLPKVITPAPPDLTTLTLPYDYYLPADIQNRIIYLEASRGCPYGCEFCLSSIGPNLRYFNIEQIMAAIEALWSKGVRSFKFIDRTFNLQINSCKKILSYFLHKLPETFFIHFEMVPDLLPEELKKIVTQFPPEHLQFEIGIQTFNEEVCHRIGRKQNSQQSIANLSFLLAKTSVHLHTDLIIGLPGESIESIKNSFDKLLSLVPHEIQVGLLKKLKGTTLGRHDTAYQMKYSFNTPYEILENSEIDFMTMQRLKRFARFWELFYNKKNFPMTLALLWNNDKNSSPFEQFCHYSIAVPVSWENFSYYR